MRRRTRTSRVILLGLIAVGLYAPIVACGADDTPARTLPDASQHSDAVVTFDTNQPDVDSSLADSFVSDASDASSTDASDAAFTCDACDASTDGG